MENPEHDDNVDERIAELRERGGTFIDTAQLQSAYRLYAEVARLGRAEQRVIPYMIGIFHQMDLALSLLEPTKTRQFALELVALLESEEAARKLQPAFPEHEYEHTVHWMTACAYENLAEATGRIEGYNSEGMHTCITDGVEVCRRTGKMACVRCFREYATEVYSAADDIPLALHHCRSISTHTGPWSNRGDRRWLGLKNEAWLLFLSGQVENALNLLRKSMPLTQEEEVGTKSQARLEVLSDLEHALVFAGQLDPAVPSPRHRSTDVKDPNKPLARGEWPWLDMRHALTDALRACCRGDAVGAQKILAPWDRTLTERKHLSDWFEVRLRLIAACRLAKQTERAAMLANQLAEKARPARDWLTLRRLARLMDDNEKVTPLALLAPVAVGPFASPGVKAHVPEEPPAAEPPEPLQAWARPQPPEPAVKTPPPLRERILALADQLEEAREDDDRRQALLAEVLAVPPTEATHPADAARLLQLAQELITDDERGAEVWQWAEGIATLHPQDATVLNLLAVLGDTLRDQSEDLEELIPADRIAHLFKTSLDLDPFHVRNHARAGAYHLHADNLGEAERCLARGFRLDRSNNFLALRLARVYRMTERPRDALAVLDMALREDADDPEVAWDAGLTAFNLEQWDAALMYFDVYEGMEPDRPWANYYRAISLLELERPNDALEAITEEERRSRDRPWPTTVLRACAHAVLGDLDGLRQRIKTVLATPLVEVDYLTVRGVSSLAERLWKASTKLPLEDPLRGDLNERLLRAGVMPDDYFDWFRMRGEKQENVNYYRCIVLQPLDENWKTWPGCLSGQEDWDAYFILWGVLALDEEEAEERVLKWQAKCYPLPAKVVKVELQHEGYTDKPGVVWQGERWEAELDEDDEE